MLLYFLFHTVSFPHFVENTVENRKTLEIPAFSRVEKCKAFSTKFFSFFFLSLKKKDFHIKNQVFPPCFQYTSHFPKSFHIFLFSTGCFFKKIHKKLLAKSFTQIASSFPHAFPSENKRRQRSENPDGISVFRTFPIFPQGLKQILLKNIFVISFLLRKGKDVAFPACGKSIFANSHTSPASFKLYYI